MIMKKNRQALNEVVDINGSKIFIENVEVKQFLMRLFSKVDIWMLKTLER